MTKNKLARPTPDATADTAVEVIRRDGGVITEGPDSAKRGSPEHDVGRGESRGQTSDP